MDNAERISIALTKIRAKMEDKDAQVAALATARDLAEQAKQQAEENATKYLNKLKAVREATQSIGLIPTLSDLKNLLTTLKALVDEVSDNE